MDITTWEDALSNESKSTSIEFEKWFLDYYGGPEQYAFALSGECEEYHTRKYFAWQGWRASRGSTMDVVKYLLYKIWSGLLAWITG